GGGEVISCEGEVMTSGCAGGGCSGESVISTEGGSVISEGVPTEAPAAPAAPAADAPAAPAAT
ncbi:MAG: hypothetical protein ACOYK7_14235, partial [Pirellulales bacterium]